jgi:elongator complex protein 3
VTGVQTCALPIYFRQIAEEEISKQKKKIQDIRSREIKNRKVTFNDLKLEIIKYQTTVSTEYFISYKTKDTDQICSFLRLSLPKTESYLNELNNSAIIREIHVYGSLVNIGENSTGESQHLGLGTKMIKIAEDISKKNKYKNLSVISAIGTKEYYRKRGFKDNELYQTYEL